MRTIIFAGTALLGLVALPSLGCFMLGPPRTPMQSQQVEQMTTCKNTDLDKIKKNLLLNGYSIRNANEDTVETEFKQVDDGVRNHPVMKMAGDESMSKTSKRVTVVKVDDTTVKFRIRVREDSVKKVETGRVTGSNGQVIASDSKLVQDQNEEDEKYFNETQQQHEETRKQICGG